jgi:hypothetical protein
MRIRQTKADKSKAVRRARPSLSRAVDDTSYDTLLQSIKGIAESIDSLNRQAVRGYTPVVEDIVRSKSRNARRIEIVLDGLLGFCGYAPALDLFRTLCRYYFAINTVAAIEYVKVYREMWDSGSKGP